jgi:DNA mismatch repair ATPase MutS
MNPDLTNFFQQRANHFHQQAQVFQKQDNAYSVARTSFFIIALILVIWFANEREAIYTTLTFLVALPIFIFLVKKHQKVIAQKKHFQYLKLINEKETKRLEGKFDEFENTGEKYLDETHSYSADLDIFGKNSLFQYLTHTVTPLGEQVLVDWLLQSANAPEINLKQEAVRELGQKIDFLQNFEATGLAFKQEAVEVEKFWAWIEKDNFLKNNPIFKLIRFVLPLFFLALLTIIAIFDLPLLWIALPFLLNIFVLGKISEIIKTTLLEVSPLLTTVQATSKLIGLIEQENFKSKKINQLKENLQHDKVSVSKEIKKLASLITNLEFRQNPYFFTFINIPFLWELHFLLSLEVWRKSYQKEAKKWFETVAELEALNSLACFHILHPDYTFPSVEEKQFLYKAKNLGHPLIHFSKRVSNDFFLADRGTIHVITGSNMSGKSTFLRTVGINAVLALAGAPVCANEMQISVLQIFTSMRTHDSLSESVSSFYAELKRIRLLLDKLNHEPPVLFLLDEILKGTNSEDRNKGAKGLIRQLHKSKLSGLVSTHDLALGELAKENPEHIKNYSFNSELINNQLYFPYQLSEGVCKSFNASVLMKMIGIEVE